MRRYPEAVQRITQLLTDSSVVQPFHGNGESRGLVWDDMAEAEHEPITRSGNQGGEGSLKLKIFCHWNVYARFFCPAAAWVGAIDPFTSVDRLLFDSLLVENVDRKTVEKHNSSYKTTLVIVTETRIVS